MEIDIKMPRANRHPVYALCIVICLMALVACENTHKRDDPALLGDLAEQYWTKRMMENDYKSCYDMELDKGSVPFSEYLKRVSFAGQIKILSVKTKEVKIEDDKGLVYLSIKFMVPPVPKELQQTLGDRWIYDSGRWKHKLKPIILRTS